MLPHAFFLHKISFERKNMDKCLCGCEDLNDGIYPFICNTCKGLWDCDVEIDGICICPNCQKKIYDQQKDI